jgi:hypothetical protein
MRQAYAHQAVLTVPPETDERAPAGAIAAALDTAHRTATTRAGDEVRLRILFTAPPHRVDEVRDQIDKALAAETFTSSDGTTAQWHTHESGCARIIPADHRDARDLLTGTRAT